MTENRVRVSALKTSAARGLTLRREGPWTLPVDDSATVSCPAIDAD